MGPARLCCTGLFATADNVLALTEVLQARFSVPSQKGKVMFGSQQSDASDAKGVTEEVEEVRVLLMQLLKELLTRKDSALVASVEPLVAIVCAACCDSAPDVKHLGCTCSVMLAARVGEAFTESHWEAVLGGVALRTNAAIAHQHAKVREAAVVAVGQLLPLAPTKMWDEMLPKCKRVHLDRHAKVLAPAEPLLSPC